MATLNILSQVLPSTEDFKELYWLDELSRITFDGIGFSELNRMYDTIKKETDSSDRRNEFNKAVASQGPWVLKALKMLLENKPNRRTILAKLKTVMEKEAATDENIKEVFDSMYPPSGSSLDKQTTTEFLLLSAVLHTDKVGLDEALFLNKLGLRHSRLFKTFSEIHSENNDIRRRNLFIETIANEGPEILKSLLDVCEEFTPSRKDIIRALLLEMKKYPQYNHLL